MALKPVSLQWGPNFANTLEINDVTTYISKTHSLFGGPGQDIVASDTLYSTPKAIREKLKERPFSITITINKRPWSADYNIALRELKRALYYGPWRLVVVRTGIGNQYLECRTEGMDEEEGSPGTFEIKAVAANSIFTLAEETIDSSGDTGLTPPYAVISIPEYPGSAPGLPVITMEVQGLGQVYEYYKEITITNPSTRSFYQYPLCIDLGDIRTDVLAGKYHEAGTNPYGISPAALRDIRLESPHGARKTIFIRDIGDRGGAWHSSVKIWTMIYSLAPGETKVLRLLHGNPAADLMEVYDNGSSSIRPMFNMYFSSNALWYYLDFMPNTNQPQTRSYQWAPYQPGADNLTWLAYQHPAFAQGAEGNIPCAGAKTMYHRPASGASGHQLTTPVSINRVTYNSKFGANGKTPLVLRSIRPDGRVETDAIIGPDKAAQLILRFNVGVGASYIDLKDSAGNVTLTRGGSTIVAGDYVVFQLNNGLFHNSMVSSTNAGIGRVYLTTPLTAGATAGVLVSQFAYTTNQVVSYPLGDRPSTIAFILRGDHPELTAGEWYFGGVEQVIVELTPEEHITCAIGASVNLEDNNLYQLRGRFGNPATNEYLRINTTVKLFDRIVIDCEARKVLYYEYDGGLYKPAVDRMEALKFEEVRKYWVHIDPALLTNTIQFEASSDANFRNLHVSVHAPIRDY